MYNRAIIDDGRTLQSTYTTIFDGLICLVLVLSALVAFVFFAYVRQSNELNRIKSRLYAVENGYVLPVKTREAYRRIEAEGGYIAPASTP